LRKNSSSCAFRLFSSRTADQRRASADRQVADHENNLVHAAVVADSAANANEEGTFMVDRRLIFVVNAGLKFMVNEASTSRRARIDPGKSAA